MRQHLHFAIIFLSLIFIGQSVSGQIGVRTKYFSNDIDNSVESRFKVASKSDAEVLSSGFGIGIDYWFRLKDKRIEFLPEIDYSFSSTSIEDRAYIKHASITSIALNFNTRVYPLDFVGDCNCPTFSNQNTLIKKGLYIELSPGINYNNSESERLITPTGGEDIYTKLDYKHLSYKIGIGTGLDIGITNLITINPYAIYNYHVNKYTDPTNYPSFGDKEYNTSQLELGLRFAIRFDAKNY